MDRLPTQKRSKVQQLPKTLASVNALSGQTNPIAVQKEQTLEQSPSAVHETTTTENEVLEVRPMTTTVNTMCLRTWPFRATSDEG